MARQSLSQVLAGAAAAFPDNNIGAITPAILRTWINDLVAAIRPAYGYLSRVGPTSQTPPAAPAVAPLVFDTGTLSPVVDYALTPGTGIITRNEHGMTRFTFTADVSPTASVNNTLTFILYQNGVATSWRQSVVLTAIGVTESITFSALAYLNATATYQMQVQATASAAMNFSNMTFVAETVPVWEYT